MWPLDGHLHSGNSGPVIVLFVPLCVSWRHNTWQLCSQHNFTMRSRLGDERPSMLVDMIVIVEGIVTVVEQRYDLYSWYVLLVDGGSMICNQIYLIPRAATWTLLLQAMSDLL